MSIQWASGMRLTPERLNAGLLVSIRKSNDETVNNNSTQQDDNHLSFSVLANAVYDVEVSLIYNSATNADIKFAFAWPTGCVPAWHGYGLATGATTFTGDVAANGWAFPSSGSSISFGGAGASDVGCRLWLRLAVGSTAGTLRLQWAQATAQSSDTIVRAGSWLQYQRSA